MSVMPMFRSLYYALSVYANASEKAVGKFFRRVKEDDSPSRLRKQLLSLIQQDVAVINLWSEYRYKGYSYLTKRTRRHLYKNLAAIHADFERYAHQRSINDAQLATTIQELGIDMRKIRTFPEQLRHLFLIMQYLSPQEGRYVYRTSSSFGRLLQDPAHHTMEGDCNQIVTLYISLYAARFSVEDLQLTLLPGHVALHFCGVDIEATTGTFVHYDQPTARRVPIQEIVSINLLDTTDTNFAQSLVNPAVFLQAARLAYRVSSERAIVEGNLASAYHNTVRYFMDNHRYKEALEYALLSKEYELIEAAATNGALYEMERTYFSQARAFGVRSTNQKELLKQIDAHEAQHEYRKHHYQRALKLYQKLGDKEAVSACYRALYAEAQESLKKVKTIPELRAHKSTIQKMQQYARASGEQELIEHAKALSKQL